MADAHRNRCVTLGDLVEQHPARALRGLVEHCPPQCRFHGAKRSPCIKGWPCFLSEGTLARGEGHDFLLLEIHFRMKSAPSLFCGKVYFYPQENHWVRLKNSKLCRMSVIRTSDTIVSFESNPLIFFEIKMAIAL